MDIRMTHTIVVAAVLALGPAVGAAHAQTDLDCRDFVYQEDAQAELNRNPGDPHRLDEDQGPDDGIACEILPSRGTTGATVSPLPTLGVNAGIGGSTRPADFAPALGAVLTAGSLALVTRHVIVRRRRSALAHGR